ncbi:MAG: hypothetical protein ACI351_00895 [Candidatus Avelusimicrobium sp.]|uniref:hypothetical protein n=1 Tax=Candidatus Avelusimicrobium sp. TaxID=3048833 RepID=UPI003F051E2A
MTKILSIFLSFCLIFGSVAPSLAQKNPLSAGIRATSAIKPIMTAQVQRVFSKTASSVMLPSRYLAAALRVQYRAGQITVSGTLNQKVEQTVQAQHQLAQTRIDFTQVQFTTRSATETIDNFATAPLTDRPQLFLNGLPQLHLVQGHPLTPVQYEQAVHFYQRLLTVSLSNPVPSKSREIIMYGWGRKMAAISNLGLYGTQADAELIVSAATDVPPYLIPYTDIITARALLTLEAYDALGNFAKARAGNGKLEAHWQGIAQYAADHSLPLQLPEISAGQLPAMPTDVLDSLKEWNALNAYHKDFSAQATEDWLGLRQHASYVVDTQAAARAERPVTIPAPQKSLYIPPHSEASLALAPTEMLAKDAPAPQVAAQDADVTTGTSLSNLVEQPKPLLKQPTGFFARFTNQFRISAANISARRTLSQTYPLPTFLKQIIEGHAADHFKEEAFVRLYEQGVLQDIIADLPKATQQKIKAWYGNQELGKRLLELYNAGIISDGMTRITNAIKQESLLQQLDRMVASPDWTERARAAYNEITVLPSNFSGVVPPMPEIKKDEILATFRPVDWAVQSQGDYIKRNEEIYYKNHIPFYYRYADGTLSSKPIGVLTQEQPNWYGQLLSTFHLAAQPGLSIPDGFVLALDEMGQWKFIMPNGKRAVVESNPKSKKLWEEIQKNGSKQVAVDTPYSSSDLLAIANLLEHNHDLNLELVMSAPHSLNLFLKVLGSYIGLDSAGALTGPFKATLKGLQGVANMMGNLVGGVGYMSPWAGGAAQGLMTKIGSIRTLQILFGASILGLGYSLFGLGMTGFQSTESLKAIPLALMALPMVTAVFAGSLLGTQMNVFLNYFKDPVARTSAHLGFAETKQWSRLGLVAGTAGLGFALDANWSIVVPVALSLVTVSTLLLFNTPVYRKFMADMAARKAAQADEQARLAALTPQQRAVEELARREAALLQKQEGKFLNQFYKNIFRAKDEVKSIAFRVRSVYASYAASLMMLGQTSTELLGPTAGQFLVGGFMLATALMRRFASKMVSSNKMTDNQLTGMSLPLLAITAAGLTLVPTTGPLIALFGTLGILHYVATAVPGQLDAARLQNLVSAEMARRKQAVIDYETMTPEQQTAVQQTWDELDQFVYAKKTKKERTDLLDQIEKSWASKASRDYSYFNGVGLAGIVTAAGAGYLFADLGPQWTKDLLDYVGSFLGDESSLITLNRLVLGYSTGVAAWLAYKNRGLTKDFFSLFNKKKITEKNIASGEITPKDFGLTAETMERQLVGVRKNLQKVEDELVDYGINSERKMTKHLLTLINVHNRLTAAQKLEKDAGKEPSSALAADFEHLRNVLIKYQNLMQRNDPSIMLQNEFNALANALCIDGTTLQTLRTDITYVPEGAYTMPQDYEKYEDATQLISELDQLAGQIVQDSVSKDTYRLFITYQARANDLFMQYTEVNPADSPRVLKQLNKLNRIVKGLKDQDASFNILERNAGPTSQQDIQELRGVLAGYVE